MFKVIVISHRLNINNCFLLKKTNEKSLSNLGQIMDYIRMFFVNIETYHLTRVTDIAVSSFEFYIIIIIIDFNREKSLIVMNLILLTAFIFMTILKIQSICFKKNLAASISALSFHLCADVGVCKSDATEVSKLYDIYSSDYNIINDGVAAKTFGIEDLRKQSTLSVRGDVLEVAVGTGLQLPYYNWKEIETFIGIDASRDMLSGAEATAKKLLESSNPKKIQFVVGDAESMGFKDNQVRHVL